MTAQSENAEAAVEEARAEVARRRAGGWYPEDLLGRLETEFESTSTSYSMAPEALAHVPSGRPIVASSATGSLVVISKRLMRRMLAWYISPIAEDVSRFNEAITAELRRLERRVERLEAERDALRKSDIEGS